MRERRYECRDCGRSWPDDLSGIAPAGRMPTESAVWWAAAEMVMCSKSVSSCTRQLHCAWQTVSDAGLARGRECPIAAPHRFDGVESIGVNEHVWRHTTKGRPVRDRDRRSDPEEGRPSGQTPGHGRRQERAGVRHLALPAMPGIAGRREGRGDGRVRRYKRAAARIVPHAVEVLDPLYRCHRALLKTAALRTDKQKASVGSLLAVETNRPLALMEGSYQKIIVCYAHRDRRKGRGMMAELIESLAMPGSAPGCPELHTLGRTMKRHMSDILAFFDHENSAHGPTEAIKGRLETLRGIALGFRNLTNYITRSLLHTGGFRQTTHTKT
ncbi:transposase [Bifidobacterium mongoliense]|uniref:transposase n=1 Tax=Bifidobacterium mongoliense TaxID=518643 RepID=UPI0030EE3342